ncbi:hypothetical protein [Acrocarpospora sp. B8E8]|uniref:hypothetical protein n=1 Tax=Acrocarpospora sp. B8E8 TaxID=3153572 RepID=UPI00325CA6BF
MAAPSNQTKRRRRRSRKSRAITAAALAAAAAFVGMVQVVAAPPSYANCTVNTSTGSVWCGDIGGGTITAPPDPPVPTAPWPPIDPPPPPPPDNPPDPPPPPPPTSPPNPPDTPGQKTSKAWNVASKAIQKQSCKDFLANAGITADQVPDVLHKSTIKMETDRTNPEAADAMASVPSSGNGQGASQITFWQPFFNESRVEGYKVLVNTSALAPLYNVVRMYSNDQIRALLVLHEVAHLTGKLPGDHSGPWGSNPNAQRAFERELALKCPIPSS